MQAKRSFNAFLLAAAVLAGGMSFSTSARGDDVIDTVKLCDQVRRSLVIVEYTFRNENGTSEGAGQGIVLNKDGVILISGGLIPEGLAKDYVKDIKIRAPGKNFSAVTAKFLGRTTDRIFSFIKADAAFPGEPLELSKTGPTKLGQEVISVALLNKSGGYETFVGISQVKATVRLTHDLAAVGAFGLTRPNSPVYDRHTGDLVGFTFPNPGENMQLTLPGRGTMPVVLNDEEQDSIFVTFDDMKDAFKNIPNAPFESPRPWVGIDGLTGLEEDVKTLYAIDQPAGVTVGSVIPGQAADKAGLKDKDIILSLNGKPFSTSPIPDLMTLHFQREIERMKVGDKVTFGILRDGKKQDVVVTLEASPKPASDLPHVFDAKLGVTTRDLVFADAYARKLPQDQKGVVVALVKQGAPASIGSTPLRLGDLITKINDQAVSDQKQFGDLLKKAESDADRKEIVFVVIRPDRETAVCRIDLTPSNAAPDKEH